MDRHNSGSKGKIYTELGIENTFQVWEAPQLWLMNSNHDLEFSYKLISRSQTKKSRSK